MEISNNKPNVLCQSGLRGKDTSKNPLTQLVRSFKIIRTTYTNDVNFNETYILGDEAAIWTEQVN